MGTRSIAACTFTGNEMKIIKVEAIPIQAKQTDDRPYWGSRAWGAVRTLSLIHI